ncbi:MAG: GC-type dockerin domain-anchored protein [Phycisphaerales bacterium]
MNRMTTALARIVPLALATAAHAEIVRVTVTGVVENNAFVSGTFAGIGPGAPVTMTIDLDSTDFLDSSNLPGVTRGYRFYPNTFSLTIGTVTTTLRSTPSTPPAYFCLRNNDPRADGFFISQGTDIDVQIPLEMTPANFGIAFLRTFNSIPPTPPDPDPTLNSVDILGAVGSWAFNNLSVYNFNIELNENTTPLIMEYQTITITVVPQCIADVDDGTGTGTPDGGVTIDDLLYYLAIFNQGLTSADVDDGTGTGTQDGGVTIDDLLYYLARFNAGC